LVTFEAVDGFFITDFNFLLPIICYPKPVANIHTPVNINTLPMAKSQATKGKAAPSRKTAKRVARPEPGIQPGEVITLEPVSSPGQVY